jgi:site-specific recombinase XerD
MEKTVSTAIDDYLDSVRRARSENTVRSYRNAMRAFTQMLDRRHSPTKKTIKSHKANDVAEQQPAWTESQPIGQLSEDAISWFADSLKNNSPATEQLYLTAAAGFYEYLAAERLAAPNLPRLRLLIKQRSRRPGQRLPQFPREGIEKTIEYAINLAHLHAEKDSGRLIALRDRALILTLADTGLRIHEACKLRRGDIDWNEGKAIIIGKGDRQAVVRFSKRSLASLKDYLAARSALDGAGGKPLPSLPLFARHDKGAGKKIKPISTRTGWDIVHQRVADAVGAEAAQSITPHSFRHYFVTTVLRASGGNLKLAQELARHRNIAVTQRYAHLSDDELDQGYYEIFDVKSSL